MEVGSHTMLEVRLDGLVGIEDAWAAEGRLYAEELMNTVEKDTEHELK